LKPNTSVVMLRAHSPETISAGSRKRRGCALLRQRARFGSCPAPEIFSPLTHVVECIRWLPRAIAMVTKEQWSVDFGRQGLHVRLSVPPQHACFPRGTGVAGHVTEFRKTLNLRRGCATGGGGGMSEDIAS
jgi:hypothetical protein